MLSLFQHSSRSRYITHFPHDNVANAPKSRRDKDILKFSSMRNTKVMWELVNNLEIAWTNVTDPRGWWDDLGFVCTSCKNCSRSVDTLNDNGVVVVMNNTRKKFD
jgi:hypothetical protein